MRKSIVIIVALVTVAFVGSGAWARQVSVTESYVKGKCGGKTDCKKDCGSSTCVYSCGKCTGDKCTGCLVTITRKTPTTGIGPGVGGTILDGGPGLPPQGGPARTGTPSSR
jgi:hypothetical protein